MRKSHPLRRVVLATVATVSGVVLLLSLKPSSDPGATQAAGAGATAQEAAQGGAGATVSGTITGDAEQTQYGTVQVRITVANGKITKSEAVQAPKGGTSDQKTELSVPKLNAAAVTQQSADIDTVSGATYTSEGYKKSLQSAIDKMKASAGSSQGSGTAQPVSGTFTGDVTQTQYGAVQVRITVVNNKITKSEAVQAPKGGTSDQKTELSVPKLNAAVVTKQSADVDTVSGATYTSEGYKKSLQSAIDKANASATSSSSGSGSASTSPSASPSGSSPSGSSGSSGAAQARTVTGTVSQTQYGPVQVRITVANGKITKAEAVQAPKGGTSDQKTALSVPKLNAAAVAAGSADIDSVSGATYTSEGYKKSLQSALDQAGG
ncbi:FMN-binding protein [Streptomyces sp. NBC_01275]|uniref:FMN-binding protein n=1 Tax=Streptomyces sp. NBC_01275 TaxID=2903807 RepID=UPI0022586E6C|nr:FMN-binding protein [Streptomyces sp. NBC_01275]MCX4760702.1 FMN-binding protein [Streptomyces sp. NBC_01275]